MAAQGRLIAGIAACATIAAACRGTASVPSPVASAVVQSQDAGSGSVLPPREAVAACDPEALHVALEDARLARARDRERQRDYSGAAREIDEARRAAAALPAEEQCTWGYVKGRMHLAAGENAEAAAELDRLSACPLREYAALRASQAYARVGRADDAVARARAAGETIALRDEAKLVLAEALANKGDRAAALPIWRSVLAAQPRGTRWVDTSVKIATAWLDGVDGDPFTHASEALDLVTRVVVEAPKLADASLATATRARAIALLRTRDPSLSDALSEIDRVRRAQAWLDASEPDRAASEAAAVLAEAKGPGALPCKAATLRAQALAKNKAQAADAWGKAISLCSEDALATALYAGAKASLGAKRTQEALDRFAEVERRFPKHRLADDARFQTALVLQGQGDEAGFLAKMGSLPADYPEGDMRAEALFRVALAHMTKGDWEAAKAPLDRIAELDPHDRHWMTAGRAAHFRGRAAAATGDMADARRRWKQVIADVPLSFYMTQSYARLAALDPQEAGRAIDEAASREEPGVFPSSEQPLLRTEGFGLARKLLEVGEIEAARRELAKAGVTGDDAPAEVLLCVGRLYARAGAPELGHAFSRTRVTEFLGHYPAGKWRVAWEVAFPRAFEPIVVRESGANGVPLALTWAVMREESSFVAEARSPSNAYGLMQLIVPTARMVAHGTGIVADETSLKRPEVNVTLGTKHIAQLRRAFPSNVALAIAAYNAGAGAVGRWLDARGGEDLDLWVEEIPYDETRGYVKRVVASLAAYAFLYDPPSMKEALALPARAVR